MEKKDQYEPSKTLLKASDHIHPFFLKRNQGNDLPVHEMRRTNNTSVIKSKEQRAISDSPKVIDISIDPNENSQNSSVSSFCALDIKHDTSLLTERMYDKLKMIYGFQEFRPGQKEVITQALLKRDCFVLLLLNISLI